MTRQQLTWHDMTCVILCKTMDGGCDVIWVGTFWVLAGLIIVGMCECLSLSGTHIHVMHYIWGNHVIRIFAATRFSRAWILMISRYVRYTMHYPFWVEVYTCLVFEGWKKKKKSPLSLYSSKLICYMHDHAACPHMALASQHDCIFTAYIHLSKLAHNSPQDLGSL